MPFNSYSYRANKAEREAREYMRVAREVKANKCPEHREMTVADSVTRLVRFARSAWTQARLWRNIRDTR